MPPKPQKHFNDYAGVVSPAAAQEIDGILQQFERDTSNQILVAIFRRMQSDSSIEDYTVRVAESWGVGRRETDNGAVLFVFVENRSMFLQVGYGLEAALPDATAKSIIENQLKPHFQRGDFEGGVRAAITGIIQATRGEYRGTGRTNAEGNRGKGVPFVVIVFAIFFILSILSRAQGTTYGRSGRSTRTFWHGGGFGGGGRGGGFSGGGGGFRGGGGSFGGGGAGGRW
jgi:uncharacterized protein